MADTSTVPPCEVLAALFDGLDRAHGEFRVSGKGPSGKVIGEAVTVKAPPTLSLWEKHLAGKQGIGIVAIRADNTCVWACLDIDDHGLDLKALNIKAQTFKLPLVICRSKSGGAHAFVFFKEPLPAVIVREHLIAWSAWLGHAGCEVFPKQIKLTDPDDVGNWLNMPYFDDEYTTRYALDAKGEALNLADFLTYAESMKATEDALAEITGPEDDRLPEAPPCLQCLASQGISAGHRNEALFNFGVYARNAYPDTWEDGLEDLNHNFFDPPLRSKEVQTVIKSLQRKEYFYRCGEPPLRPLCNKSLCKTRQFGIGGGEICEVEITGLVRLETKPPVWFADVDGMRIRLDTGDLANQARFGQRCMEDIGKLPTPKKANDWRNMLNQLMGKMECVEVPPDSSPEGQLWEHLWAFAESAAAQGSRKEDLLLMHKIWREDGRVWFRLQGLLAYLAQHRFADLTTRRITALLNQSEITEHKQWNIKDADGKNKCVQCWGVNEI